MLHDIDLRRLSAMENNERAYVSCYLNGAAGRQTLDRRERKIRAALAGEEDERVHFDESMKLVRRWLEENDRGDRPCCVFACWADDWVEGYVLGVELPDRLRLGPAPFIRPLAELQEEYESFVVVAADNEATRIWTVTAERAELEQRIRGHVKNRVKKGGWSQKRYARRREKQLQHYAKEVAEVLDRLVRDEGIERIVLLGSKETLEEIEAELSQAARACVVGKKGADVHEEQSALVEDAFELFFEEERAEEQRLWERIRAEALSDGLAAIGPDEVLRAALVGRVATVVVTRDAKVRATRCRACENVYAGENERCEACGSEDVFTLDLVDSLARHLELSSAEIEFADPIPGLGEAGDVAALLRY